MLRREKDKRKPVKKSNSSARFNQRTFSVFLDSKTISLSTVAGRKRIPFMLPEYFRKYENGEVVALRARERSSAIIIDLIVELPDVPVREADNPMVVGIDRGVNNIAVTSDGEFFNSRKLRNIRSRYVALTGRLPVNEPIVACHDIKPRNLVEHSYKPRPLGRGI